MYESTQFTKLILDCSNDLEELCDRHVRSVHREDGGVIDDLRRKYGLYQSSSQARPSKQLTFLCVRILCFRQLINVKAKTNH